MATLKAHYEQRHTERTDLDRQFVAIQEFEQQRAVLTVRSVALDDAWHSVGCYPPLVSIFYLFFCFLFFVSLLVGLL